MPPPAALRRVLPPLSHPALGDTVRRKRAIGRSPREKYRISERGSVTERSRARRGLKTRRVVRRASTSRGNTRRDDHVAPSTRVHPSDRTPHALTPRPAFRPLLQKQFQNKTKDHVRARYERHGQGCRRPQGDRVQAPRLRLHGPPRRPQGPRRRYVPPPSQRMPKNDETKKNLVPLLRNLIIMRKSL